MKPTKVLPDFPAPGTLRQTKKLADYLKREAKMKIISITKDGPGDDPKIEAHNGERPLLYSVFGVSMPNTLARIQVNGTTSLRRSRPT